MRRAGTSPDLDEVQGRGTAPLVTNRLPSSLFPMLGCGTKEGENRSDEERISVFERRYSDWPCFPYVMSLIPKPVSANKEERANSSDVLQNSRGRSE